MKASKLIERALGVIQVRASEQPITAAEMNTGVEYLNDMMASWDSISRSFGYTKVTNPDDETNIPDWANRAVIFNLGVEMAPEYGKTVDQILYKRAEDSLRILRNRINPGVEMLYPNILPIGEANKCWDTYQNFFPDLTRTELDADQDGVIQLEDGETLNFDNG